MISHDFPVWDTFRARRSSGGPVSLRDSLKTALGCVQSVWGAAYGPLRGELHAAARLQGARVDPRCVSRSARQGRLRGSLLLSGAGLSRDRCGRARVDSGDRCVDRTLQVIFGRARAARSGAVRYERDTESRWRGAGGAERETEAPRRNHRHGVIRRSRSEVSDLGAWPFRRKSSRRPPKRCARSRGSWVPRWRRKMRSEHGNDGGRRRLGCRWRTGPSRSRARRAMRVEFLNVRDGGVYIDGTFGAGGYTPRHSCRRRCAVSSASTATGARSRAARIWSQQPAGRLTLVEERFSELDARRARSSATRRWTASCSISASPRCSLTRPSAAFRSGSTGRSTCAWAATAPSAADVVAQASRARSRRHHLPARRGAPFARRRPRHRRARAVKRRSSPPRAGRHRRHAWCVRGRTKSIRRRGRSRRCAFSSTRSWRAGAGAGGRRARCSSPAAGWSS